MAQCAIPDCPKPTYKRGWCAMHYNRWRRHGDPHAVLIQTDHPPLCTVAGCDDPYLARGWCRTHYARWVRTGSTDDRLPATYSGAHARMQRLRGRAADHPCADCGQQANEWSYTGPSGGWSNDPDDYQPRCWSCHARFDARR